MAPEETSSDAALGRVQAPGQRVEAVDDGLELRREAEVVHRRGEGDDVGLHQLLAQLLEVVLEDARAVHVAGVARAARADLGLRRVEAEDLVTGGLGALDEARGQGVGVAVFAGAPRQDDDFHGLALLSVPGRRRAGQRRPAKSHAAGHEGPSADLFHGLSFD